MCNPGKMSSLHMQNSCQFLILCISYLFLKATYQSYWKRFLLLLGHLSHTKHWYECMLTSQKSQNNTLTHKVVHVPLFGAMVPCFNVPGLSPDWGIRTKGSLLSWTHEGKSWYSRHMFAHKDGLEMWIEVTGIYDSAECYLGKALARGAGVSSKPLQKHWLHKTYPKQHYYGVLELIRH